MKIYTWGIEEKHVNNQENEIEIYNLFLSIFLIIHYLSDHFLFVSLSLSLSHCYPWWKLHVFSPKDDNETELIIFTL